MGLFEKLQKRPSLFLSTTGMELSDFQRLLPRFEAVYREREAQRKSRVVKTGAQRERLPGGGPRFGTPLRERLLMLLIYYRLYLTQEFMTLLFAVEHKSTICRAIRQMRPVFEAVLPVPERAGKTVLSLARTETERRASASQKRLGRRINNLQEALREYPELAILIDGVEQPKRRPSDQHKRKSHYSGKKKRHTLKQILTATPSGIIVDQSRSCGGRRHDFALFKKHVGADSVSATCVEGQSDPVEEPTGTEPTGTEPTSTKLSGDTGFYQQLKGLRVTGYADSGFTGLDGLGLPMSTRLVERARRGHPLSSEQKSLNRVRSRERIKIEHVFSRRKKYRIASEVYRNRDADYDPTMNVVGGLVNLRAYGRLDAQYGVDLMAMHL